MCVPLALLQQVRLALPGWGSSSSSSHRGAVALQDAALHALVPQDVGLVQPAAACRCSSFWVQLCGKGGGSGRERRSTPFAGKRKKTGTQGRRIVTHLHSVSRCRVRVFRSTVGLFFLV